MYRNAIQRIVVLLLLLVFIAGYALYAEASALSEKIVRLHVIANSDSEADQELKLHVRDAVLELASVRLDGVSDRESAQTIIGESLSDIEEAARNAVKAAGYDYDVDVEIGVEKYPTREYESISLPAGEYLSLRVIIGEGEGKNWWCVVFPPVCLTAATKEDLAVMDFTESEISLMTGENTGYVIRFKLLELIGRLRPAA